MGIVCDLIMSTEDTPLLLAVFPLFANICAAGMIKSTTITLLDMYDNSYVLQALRHLLRQFNLQWQRYPKQRDCAAKLISKLLSNGTKLPVTLLIMQEKSEVVIRELGFPFLQSIMSDISPAEGTNNHIRTYANGIFSVLCD
jgi:hypothetical protein